MKLSVREHNRILREWPFRTEQWPLPGYRGFWCRARPSTSNDAQPFIATAGATANTTEPDGLYLFVHDGQFADCIAIEICGSRQNFYDKRSRYTTNQAGLVVRIPLDWLFAVETLRGRNNTLARWDASKWFPDQPTDELALPIRHLRVLFAIPDDSYHTWAVQNGPAGHEYFCMHSHIALWRNRNVQRFLKGMALMKHFLRRPRRGAGT